MFPRAVYGGIRCSDIETIDQMAKWLNGGGDINSREVSIFWETPLILQAIKGNTDVVKYLILLMTTTPHLLNVFVSTGMKIYSIIL